MAGATQSAIRPGKSGAGGRGGSHTTGLQQGGRFIYFANTFFDTIAGYEAQPGR
ncbi:hypothetical protein SAMN04490220_5562 [Rhodococcus jostii]|uniref:Uncharacterized protein n=1 Tax=Rhodococcus jostii TaxID=132919 RepID=A0A1H5DJU6_RHOJO|nr:hypothetical protein SAMN04490220_5562 [Rhodococcus jostii]